MHSLNFQALSSGQLLAMADGLVASGNLGLAKQLYEVGGREATDPDIRRRFGLRLGLLTNASPGTPSLVRVAKELESLDTSVFVGDGLATWMKTAPFDEDERFLTLAAKHASLLPLSNWHWNLQTVLWAVQETSSLDGDLVELGVFRGHTTLFIADYVEFERWPKRWCLFDTFEGIPA